MRRYLPVLLVIITAAWVVQLHSDTAGPREDAAAQAASAARDRPTHRFEELAEGVYFAVGTGVMTTMSNSLAIINESDVMIVDTHVTPAAARALVESVKTLTDKPIRYVINSHYHFDHAHGNQIFGDDVEIVGHQFVREMLLTNVLEQRTNRSFASRIPAQIEDLKRRIAETSDPSERARLDDQRRVREAHLAALAEVRPTPPTVTYRETMTIHRGGREVQLHFLGRGHTGGDTVVFLPKERLVFTGDLMEGRPGGRILSYLGDAYVDEWIDTLERLKALDFDTIVPGHGAPFTERTQIDDFQAYLRDLWTQVTQLRGQGVSAEDAAPRVDLSAHQAKYGRRSPGADPRAVLRIYELLQARAPL